MRLFLFARLIEAVVFFRSSFWHPLILPTLPFALYNTAQPNTVKKSLMVPVFAVALLLLGSATLQAQKFGYVNSLELINLMPESRAADSLIKAYQQEVQGLYNGYTQEYTAKSQDYLRVKDSVSEFVASSRLADLQALEKRIKDFEASSQPMLEQRRTELFQPVLARAQTLIKEVAEENNYRMIFDTANGSIAYAPEGDNVIGLLRKKLGLKPLE